MHRVLIVVLIILLTACSGAPRARMFPPGASLQEIHVREDGRWELAVLLQNNARLPVRMSGFKAALSIDGQSTATIELPLDILIASSGAERVQVIIDPSAESAAALRLALAAPRGVDYSLAGVLNTIEPARRSDEFIYQSRLSPAPGLPGTLR